MWMLNNFDGNLGRIHHAEGEIKMPLIILEDSTMLEFDEKKYFRGLTSSGARQFVLKPEFVSCNRPTKIVIDFVNKTYYEEFKDGHPRTLKFVEVI